MSVTMAMLDDFDRSIDYYQKLGTAAGKALEPRSRHDEDIYRHPMG
jgi:hypothetical protein